MVEKVKLEKLNVVNRLDYLADKTYNRGQSNLTNIQSRFGDAIVKKEQTLEKLKARQAKHIEVVENKYETSILTEEERKMQAMAKTQDQTISFLQRLEQTNKERDDEHKTKFGNVHTRTDEVKQR